MTCNEVQRILSRGMDGAERSPGGLDGHLACCEECRGFRDAAGGIENAYRIRVRAGVDRLRRVEGLPPWGKSREPRRKAVPAAAWVALAAAGLLCAWGLARMGSPPRPPGLLVPQVARVPAPAPWPPRTFPEIDDVQIAVADGEDVGRFLREPALPLRLDQDWGCSSAFDLESPLPVSLRF